MENLFFLKKSIHHQARGIVRKKALQDLVFSFSRFTQYLCGNSSSENEQIMNLPTDCGKEVCREKTSEAAFYFPQAMWISRSLFHIKSYILKNKKYMNMYLWNTVD